MHHKLVEHSLRLFKSVPISKKLRTLDKEECAEIYKETIPHGIIFDDTLMRSSRTDLDTIIQTSIDLYGISNTQVNSAFHKSWKKISEASDIQLVMEQIIHYITTYGFKALGIFDESTVYIPFEELELPTTERLNLTPIKAITMEELREKVMNMLTSGIALKQEQVDSLVILALEFDPALTRDEVELITNREAKVQLYDELLIVPGSPVEFLRYLIYILTGKTLLIKDSGTLTALKDSMNMSVVENAFHTYIQQEGIERLGAIFYRYKPIFLAFKGKSKSVNTLINKIRRSAVKNHKPVQKDLLNNLTDLIISKKGNIDVGKLDMALQKATIFRKIRLANALLYRVHSPSTAYLYQVRNGKSYVKEGKELNTRNRTHFQTAYKIVVNSIGEDLSEELKGKKVYIPENMNYAAPTSEKNFIGNFPQNTIVELDRDCVVGVHWEDVDYNTIDLDLSLLSITGKIGWNGYNRTDNRDVMFSGDLTSAPKPHGSAELFRITRYSNDSYLIYLNYFNYMQEVPVPYSIFVAEAEEGIDVERLMDTAKIVAMAKTELETKQRLIGAVIPDMDKIKICFFDTSIGKKTIASNDKVSNLTREYLLESVLTSMRLTSVLNEAGVEFIKDKEEADIDLSPEVLEKDTIINLLLPKGE